MRALRFSLWIFTLVIFGITLGAVVHSGSNWPSVFFSDLVAVNWRSQFNTDLVIHLSLMGAWVAWREGGGGKGYLFGAFCVIWGGMFTFPYLLIAIARARGDMADLLLGVHRYEDATTAR